MRATTPTRREFMKAGALGVAGALTALRADAADEAPIRATGGQAMKGPIFNQDDSEFCAVRGPGQVSGEAIDAWVDGLADAGVGTLLTCVCACRTNYASKVWEPRWTGYDPAGPDDQPVLRHLPAERVKGTRRWVESEKRLAELGINFHERAYARCKQRGVGAWASIRMNDLHDCDLPDSPLLSTFYKEQRDSGKTRVPYRQSSWPDRALDWGRAEVRDYYMALVKEVLGFEGLEGLELDWMRFGYHFQIGHELEGGEVLTAWLREVRRLCNERAQAVGHPVRLGCRVPSTPQTARSLGLDGVRWARERIIDLLVPTPFWQTCEFNMPMRTWRRLLEGTGCALAGGLEIRYQAHPAGPAPMMTPDLAVGAATAVLHGGADHVYLFNYFLQGHLAGLWAGDRFRRTIRAMKSLEGLEKLARRHAVTFRDVLAPGEYAPAQLPATLGLRQFRLQTGPKPAGRKVELLVEVEVAESARAVAPTARVNSTLLGDPRAEGKGVFVWAVPAETLTDEETVVELQGDKVKVVRVEVGVE